MNGQPDPTLGAPFSSFPDNRLTVAQMGPGEPAENFPLGGEPRQWVYRVGWNFPTTPDTDRGISGMLLRMLADSFWLLRRCIEIRKAEICGLDWEIVPRGRNGRERRENGEKHEALMRELKDFFRYPESYYSFVTSDEDWVEFQPGGFVTDRSEWERRGLVDWGDWLNAVLEDYFVGDWVSIWPQRTLGNEMLGLRRVDGEHIKALLDLDGRVPPPPMPAFQQYLYGVPRASWAADEFYFMPRNVRNMTPYGYSHVQQALILINLGLKFDQWNTAAYTESTIPMGLLESAPGQTAQQIKDVADWLNGQVQGLAQRQMVYPVPSGTKWQAIKPFVFDEKFAMYLIETVCGCMDVQPQELGFAPSRASLGGAGFAEQQAKIQKRKGLLPLARWLERKFTRIINDQWHGVGGEFLEFRFQDLMDDDEQAKIAQNAAAIKSGQVSLDQILEENGQGGIGVGHIIETEQAVIFADKGYALVANGTVVELPFLEKHGKPSAPSPVTGDPKASAPPLAGKGASGETPGTREREKEVLMAWLAVWKSKAERAAVQSPDRPEMARDALRLTDAEELELARILDGRLRRPVYEDAIRHIREREGVPDGPWAAATPSDLFRLTTQSQTRMQGIANTYHTDLSRAYDDLLAGESADRSESARRILDLLVLWVLKHIVWKGEEIAATEATEAQAQAERDFAVQNPAVLRQWRWQAVMDEKTCDVCAGLDGQVIDANGPMPPAHPNCRCHLVPAGDAGVSTDSTSGPERQRRW